MPRELHPRARLALLRARWSLAGRLALIGVVATPRDVQAAGPAEGEGRPPPAELENVEHIENVELADLLGMDLDDQLGTTEAVSREDESVLRAPATLTTLDARAIHHAGVNSFPELLRAVPGVQVVRNSSGNYLVSLRGAGGITGNNVVVMLDGVPLNSPVDSSVDWDLVPIAITDVERVEIVRGPVSPIYGPDAYTGVINIVSRETALRRHSAGVLGLGGVDLHAAPAGIGAANYVYSGDRATFKWFGTGRYDDTANHSGDFRHPAWLQVGSTAALAVETGAASQFTMELGGAWSRRGSLDQLVLESRPSARGLAFAALAWRIAELPSVLDGVQVWGRSRARFIRTDADSYLGFSYADTNAIRSDLGVDLDFDFHRKVHGRLGASGTLDWIDAPYLHPAVSGQPWAGMSAYTGLTILPTDSLDLGVHARLDLPPVTAKATFSLRAAMVFHRRRWALRLAVASSLRSPSYVEAGGQFRDPATNLILLEGTPDIRAPRQGSLELGATISPITGLTIRPVAYVSALSSTMVEDFEPLVRKTFITDPRTRVLVGGELELDWDIIDQLTLRAGGGLLHFVLYDENVTPQVGDPDQNSSWTASLRLFGSTTNERFGYGVGAVVSAPRHYLTHAGIPPQIIDVEVPHTGYLDARFEAQPSLRAPLWLSLTGQAGLPPEVSEGPFPIAAHTGAVVMLGLEWRRE